MLKRIAIYLNEMFPISAIFGSVITALAVQLTYLRLFNIKPDSALPLLVPALVLTAISLLIRIMDEFKDYQDDLTNFPERPLPSGRVLKKDLLGLGIFCVMLTLFLSMTSTNLLIWAIITLSFSFLMLKWFFIESIMRKNLPLAFITHHPIVLFNFIYLLIACTQMNPAINFGKALYILPVCLIFTNWEIARKIRAPEQETSYTTYSKIWGPRPAIIVSLILQTIFIAAVMNIFEALNTHVILRSAFIAIQLSLIFPSVRFLYTLKLSRPLKPLAEAQILIVVLTLLIAAVI